MSTLPAPRGPLSEALFDTFRQPPHDLRAIPDATDDEDMHLALYCCYELHYRGFDGVDDRWEWEPSLLRLRGELEHRFEGELHERVGPPGDPPDPSEIDLRLRELMQADETPSVSSFIEREATIAQVLEFMIHRSAYQLKEADPHSWALPRLWGRPKAAMVEVQADEYGNGRPDDVHAELSAHAMHAVGLDSTYGAYLDQIPGVTLATVNLMSMCGLHRRLRGAIVGHLALFEMTSSVPNRRYARGLRRLGYDGEACLFFDVHVVADAVHESVAAVDLAGGLAKQDPALGADVLWGARALLEIDGRWARHMLSAWEDNGSSLRPTLALH
jgi:Iron-containing redox enzyme